MVSVRRALRRITTKPRRWADLRRGTYGGMVEKAGLLTHPYLLPVTELRPYADQIGWLAQQAIKHRFDLLGSGWVQVKHGMVCRGVEGFRYEMGQAVDADSNGAWLVGRINRANEAEARRIWGMIGPGYTPIDWQIDFKSGYRWAEDCWYQDIPYGHLPGVDIKVPWELARMQVLPQLAWAYALASTGEPGFDVPEVYRREFRCQVLDFIATNPPRFGVNWAGAMDVAIRIVNWLITYDLFCVYGAQFDEAFGRELVRSAIQHGRHILANRDWHAAWRGNHYLAEMAGLFVVGVYLSVEHTKENFTTKSAESAKKRRARAKADRWVNLALRELDREVALQFHEDGSNFEASTSYHRLSAEMIVYASALALNLASSRQNKTGFPLAHRERIEKMGEFTQHITKPSGRVPQIGDNDSGRFLRLFPAYERLTVEEACARYANLDGYESDDEVYWDEDVLDHGHLLAAMNGLFGRADWPSGPETMVVRGLAGGRQIPSYRRDGVASAAEQVRWGLYPGRAELDHPFPTTQGKGSEGGVTNPPLQTYAYPDFGLYVFRSGRVYLAVRCGPIGKLGSHAHNDQLAVELAIDGEDLIVDPGTYLYTALPDRRNEYRSVRAHFAPQVAEGEPGRLDIDLFRLGDEARAECLYFGPEGFIGVHYGYGFPVYRTLRIETDQIVIEDSAKQPLLEGDTTAPPLSLKYGSWNR